MKILSISHDSLCERIERHRRYIKGHSAHGQFLDLSNLEVSDFDFSELDLNNVVAAGSVFIRCQFNQALMQEFQFESSRLVECDFSGANLYKAEFYETTLEGGIFSGANGSRTEFTLCKLVGIHFDNCELAGASFSDCGLRQTTLGNTAEKKIQVEGLYEL